jgi:alkylhydroperoxidase family enzyme
MPRIPPVQPPYPPETARQLAAMMPAGLDPIGLFRTFAVNLPMAQAMSSWGRYELSRALSLSLRDREIVIDRTCALTGCQYEWGVHVAFFADRAGLLPMQIASLTHGQAQDACWVEDRDRALIRATDQLHATNTLDEELAAHFTDLELLDLCMLAGWYHAISYAARVSGVELEPWAPSFDSVRLS